MRERCEGEISPAVTKFHYTDCVNMGWKSFSGSFGISGALTSHYSASSAQKDHKGFRGGLRGLQTIFYPSVIKYLKSIQSGGLPGWSTHQDSITVDDGVKSVSDGQDCALSKLVPDSLLDKAVCPERAGNTTPQHTHSLPVHPWVGALLNTGQWLISSQVDSGVDTKVKQQQGLSIFNMMLTLLICAFGLYFTE